MDAEIGDAGENPDAAPDAGPSPRVEVGTGSLQFESLVAGQTVELSAGFQGGDRYGGFHIWMGARIWELEPRNALASFIVLHASDRREMARLRDQLVTFRETTSDAHEIWSAAPILEDCCAARGQPLILRVEVVDADQQEAFGEIEVVGAAECINRDGDQCL